jgi:hypothetical protein
MEESSGGGGGGQEEVVAKYKRLLTLARSSIESNQKLLAEKDVIIGQLKGSLEEERQNHRRGGGGSGSSGAGTQNEEEENWPRNISRRIDVGSLIWILVEHQAKDDHWLSFRNEQELDDFIQRIPGAPLHKPPRCLTIEESAHIVCHIPSSSPLTHHRNLRAKKQSIVL